MTRSSYDLLRLKVFLVSQLYFSCACFKSNVCLLCLRRWVKYVLRAFEFAATCLHQALVCKWELMLLHLLRRWLCVYVLISLGHFLCPRRSSYHIVSCASWFQLINYQRRDLFLIVVVRRAVRLSNHCRIVLKADCSHIKLSSRCYERIEATCDQVDFFVDADPETFRCACLQSIFADGQHFTMVCLRSSCL